MFKFYGISKLTFPIVNAVDGDKLPMVKQSKIIFMEIYSFI